MNSGDKPSGKGGPDGIDTSDPNPGQGESEPASQATGDSKGFLFNKGKLCHRFFTLIFASKGRIIATVTIRRFTNSALVSLIY